MKIVVATDRTITFLHGDITQQHADAIVNAANSALLPGGGVCGVIHRAGGPAIAAACGRFVQEHGEVAPGKVAATTAGKLPVRCIIHAVGPVWSGGRAGEAETLASCYREAIALAGKLGLRSIVFPAISTGIFGYPIESAAAVAVEAAAEALQNCASVRDARFVLFDRDALQAFEGAANALAERLPGLQRAS